MTESRDTTGDISRVSQAVTLAQWGVAAVVMVGSAMSAWSTFAQLHGTPVIGAVIALGVDLALASGLVVSQRLRALGIENSPWGTALMWLTAAMTLALNVGADVVAHRWGLVLLHAFPPILMVVLTEAGSANQLRVMRKRQEREAAEQARRDAQDATRRAEYEGEQRRIRQERDAHAAAERAEQQAREKTRREAELQRARGVLVDAQDHLAEATEQRRQAEAEKAAEEAALRELAELLARREAQEAAAQAVAERVTKPPRPKPSRAPARGKKPASAEQIRAWISAQRAAGLAVASGDVVAEFGHRRGDEARLIRQVEADIDAELAKVANGGN